MGDGLHFAEKDVRKKLMSQYFSNCPLAKNKYRLRQV